MGGKNERQAELDVLHLLPSYSVPASSAIEPPLASDIGWQFAGTDIGNGRLVPPPPELT